MSMQASESVKPTIKVSAKTFAKQDIVYVLVLGGAIFYAIAWKFCEDTSVWAQVLFSLPVAAQLIGGGFHIRRARERGERHRDFYNFSMWTSTAFIGAYCVLWVIYSNGLKAYQVFSWLALLFVTGLICLVGYMMCAFLQVPDGERWPSLIKLRDGAAAEPLWAMSFLFFVIFLDVTFLFGFAFAFHDQYCLSVKSGIPALRMVNLDSPDDMFASSTPAVGPTPSSGKEALHALKEPNAALTKGARYFFYFDSVQAHVDQGNYGRETEEEAKKAEKENDPADPANKDIDFDTKAINAKCDVQDGDVSPLKRSIWVSRDFKLNNFCSLAQIKKRIEKETSQGKHTRIILIGRADDKPIIENRRTGPNDDLQRYKSNYELSEARVQNVRYEIVEALKKQDDTETWHNLEWLTLPSSNENPETDDELKKILELQPGLSENMKEQVREINKRVVQAAIVAIPNDITSLQMKQLSRSQFKELSLIDYMYFSIYTITTTGYGDIIPTTSYSKFVISIANICEVLFLVVFFNALVSIKGDKKHSEINLIVDFVKVQMTRESKPDGSNLAPETDAKEPG